MLELELSYIPDSDVDTKILNELLDKFYTSTGTKVNLKAMSWGTAWADLMTIATHGKGPDVSHIGGTWVSSLAMMNALRPFKPQEIDALGGSSAFLPSTWESTKKFDDARTWSIPWTSYIYVICYRKDMFAKAGITETASFRDIVGMSDVLQTLQSSGVVEIPWLNPYIPAPFTDLLHIAASWVWSAGGDFINPAGSRVVFDSPEAIKGLCGWMESYRAVPDAYKQLDWTATVSLFRGGRAAAVLTDIRVANAFIAQETNPVIRENLGVVPITNIPWTGGGSFVVWQHVLGYPERERSAIELIKFLNSTENCLRWTREVGSMPARMDVLNEIYPQANPLHASIQQTINHGRAYHTVPLWRRIEFQLAQELGASLQEANTKPNISSENILRPRLQTLARRLNLTLGN